MSKPNKYAPPVNIPEAVPDRADSICVMLFPMTQHVAFSLDKLMLKQLEPGIVAVGYVPEPNKFAPLATFAGNFTPAPKPGADDNDGKILLAEKTIVVP